MKVIDVLFCTAKKLYFVYDLWHIFENCTYRKFHCHYIFILSLNYTMLEQ